MFSRQLVRERAVPTVVFECRVCARFDRVDLQEKIIGAVEHACSTAMKIQYCVNVPVVPTNQKERIGLIETP